MKKLILIIFVLLAMPVYALNEYTEYEFVGTQDTVPTVDEFTKYETVTLHRFYSLEEGPKQIVKDDIYKNYDFWELIDTKTIATKTPNPEHKNEIHFISRAMENLKTTSISVKNLDEEYVTLEKIVFKTDGQEFYTETEPPKNSFTIPIEPHKLNELEIEFYYRNRAAKIEFTINLNSGSKTESGIVPLLKEYDKITVSFKTLDEYTNFLGANDLDYKFSMTYYTHIENTYECYNYDKVYLETPLEEESVEGYTYDEEENITLYKVYKRNKIEDEQKSSDVKPPTVTAMPEPSQNGSTSTNPMKTPTVSKPITQTSQIKDKTVDNYEVFDNEQKEDEEKTEIQEETLAFIDKEDTTSKESPTYAIDYDQNEKIIDLLKDIKWLLTILIILIIIRLIHTFSVNIAE